MNDQLISIAAPACMLGWYLLHVWIGSRIKRRWALIVSIIEIVAFFALVFLIYWQINASSDKSGMMSGGMFLILAFFVLVIPALLSLISLFISRWWRRI
ncbi:hypothetical protein [Sphingobium algorifonticola]|uniref:Uncharacterized protein n=1 Tax=Sphingobium algorifonticola TaxID=2008318 RepID=A0A437JBV1_9SPHN|nr:hypothetical protein [Sphingobium algorifonticola]RVT43379.1 hypothetical protein ENE74_01740 [Sphingobium algorifonticola]